MGLERRKPAKESDSGSPVRMVRTEVTVRFFAYLVEDGSKHQLRAKEEEVMSSVFKMWIFVCGGYLGGDVQWTVSYQFGAKAGCLH